MSELTKAQKLRARKEMVRQKQQAAIEKKDIARNAKRAENIRRRKNAAEKMGKTFSYGSTVTPSAEGGPINYGSPMKKSCIKMYDEKGKQTGLMMEGSVAHMESNLDASPLEAHGPGGSHPKPKKKKPTTTLKNALASDQDYQVVPGFEERLGGELEGVVLTGQRQTNKQKRQAKREARRKERKNTYSKTGIAIKTLGTFLPGGGGKYERRQLEKTARKGLF